MIDLIILFTILFLLFLIAYNTYKDIMSPSVLTIGTLTIIIGSYIAAFSVWPQRNYGLVCMILGLSAFCFFLGSVCAKVIIRISRDKLPRRTYCYSGSFSLPVIYFNNIQIIIVSVLVVVTAIIAGGHRLSMLALHISQGVDSTTEVAGGNSLMDILLQVLYALTYIIEYTIVQDLILKRRRYNTIRVLLILPMNIIGILCGTRFTIFMEIMYVLSVYNLLNSIFIGKRNNRIMKTIIKSFSVTIFSFVGIGFFASKINKGRNIIVILYKYFTVGIYGLTYYISTFHFDKKIIGENSFNNLYRVLNLFGLNIEYKYSTISKHYYVNNTIGAANLYTSIMNFLSDFNYAGTMIVMFILGFTLTKFYADILKNGKATTPFRIIVYSSMFYLIIAMWIEQNPINMILSSSFIVKMVLIYIITRIIKKEACQVLEYT